MGTTKITSVSLYPCIFVWRRWDWISDKGRMGGTMGRSDRVWVARALHISPVWKNCLVPVQKTPLYTTSYPHWHKDSPLGLWPMGELHWGRDTPRGISAMENPCQGSENAQNRSYKFLLVGNKWKKIIWLKSLLHTAHSLAQVLSFLLTRDGALWNGRWLHCVCYKNDLTGKTASYNISLFSLGIYFYRQAYA